MAIYAILYTQNKFLCKTFRISYTFENKTALLLLGEPFFMFSASVNTEDLS